MIDTHALQRGLDAYVAPGNRRTSRVDGTQETVVKGDISDTGSGKRGTAPLFCQLCMHLPGNTLGRLGAPAAPVAKLLVPPLRRSRDPHRPAVRTPRDHWRWFSGVSPAKPGIQVQTAAHSAAPNRDSLAEII